MASLYEAGDAMVAVVQWRNGCFVVLGSGVMIGPGLLLTATHVLDEFARDGVSPAFLTFLPDAARAWLPHDSSNLSRADSFNEDLRRSSDLTLVSCTLNSYEHEQHPLTLAPLQIALPLIGERLWAFGYRHGEIDGDVSAITPLVSSGCVTAVYPHGRGEHMPAACIEVDMDTKGGMSGGPVVNSNGDLVAIVSSSYEGGPSYMTLIWEALRLRVKSSVRPFQNRGAIDLFAARDFGLVRIKGNFKRRRSGDVVLTLTDAEVGLLVKSVDASAITRVDPNSGRFLDEVQLDMFMEQWGHELENSSSIAAIEFLTNLSLPAVRRFLAADDVPPDCLEAIQAFSVEDFEGLEDGELISAQEIGHEIIAISFAFDLLSVIWTVEIPSSAYCLRAADFDAHFMNIKDSGTVVRMEAVRRCYFEADLRLDINAHALKDVVVSRTGVRRSRRSVDAGGPGRSSP